jgi:hypothetical protein
MTRRDHIVGWSAIVTLVAGAVWIVHDDGLGHLLWLAWVALIAWVSIKAANWLHAQIFGGQRLQTLRERAHAIGRECGLATAVLPCDGHRYTVTAQHWQFAGDGPENAFACSGTRLTFEQALVFLEGLRDGQELADWRASHPHEPRREP